MPDGFTYRRLLEARARHGAVFILLVDPGSTPVSALARIAATAEGAGVDGFFVGGSLVHVAHPDEYVAELKRHTALPVIGFPGAVTQVVPSLDAVLYLSVVSGRNPEYLIGQHVHGAPLIRRMGLETISTGYMLIESGTLTTAQYLSGSLPIPRGKPEVAAATALAAEMMGMKLLYTDAGSGAEHAVSDEMVGAIATTCKAPLIVGGGLRSPEAVLSKVRAGAAIIVVGNAVERNPDVGFLSELVAASHTKSHVPH